MIFIKNCTTDLKGKDISVGLEEDEKLATLNLYIRGEHPIPLVKSTVDGVAEAIRKSIKYIASITNTVETPNSSCILDNKESEIAFFVKGKKTVLKETSTFPNIIGEYDDVIDKDKHYPRDMILMIVPQHDENHNKLIHRLVVDRRNLGGPIQTIKGDTYSVIVMYVKYPIWSNLKFEAYAYIKTEKEDGSSVVNTAFKLGTSPNKNLAKNQIIDVDPKVAVDYLEESFRILREKKNATSRQDHKSYKPNDYKKRDNFRPRDKGSYGGNNPYNNKKGSNHGYNSKHGFNSANTKSRNRFAK